MQPYLKHPTPQISVVVCTYNRSGYLGDTLESLYRQDAPRECFEVVVVDNNSSDDTREIVDAAMSRLADLRLRYVFEPRQGLSHARNRGIDEAAAPLVAFVDDDIFADEHCVSAYLRFFESHPAARAAGGAIRVHFDSAPPPWLSPRLMPLLGEHNLGRDIRRYPRGRYPLGGNMCFRREVFETLRFDPELGRKGSDLLASEEKDLFQRLRAVTDEIYHVPDAVVHHRVDGRRFTEEFVRKQAVGIGRSERVRTGASGTGALAGKWSEELVKAGGTVVLATGYLLKSNLSAARMLLKFRYWIWRGLLGR